MMPKAKELVISRIYECLLIHLRRSKDPNPYSLLSIITLLTEDVPEASRVTQKIDKELMEKFVNLFLNEDELAMKILKVSRESRGFYEESKYRYSFIYSSNPQEKEKFHQSWPLYLMLTSKLLLMMIEHSSENSKVVEKVQEFMSVEMFLLDAMNCNDLLESIAIEELSATLMKR